MPGEEVFVEHFKFYLFVAFTAIKVSKVNVFK